MPNVDFMEIMFEGTVATGKCISARVVKYQRKAPKGFEDSADSKEFVDPNVNPLRMLTQWRLKAHHRRE